ncbi:DUF5994 family protein [Nocardioides soli]|uniref:DUF5994 family protein n=1 Tax=Nocardioides soli TaxID=1036020 RepID=UPI001C84C32D
MTTSPNTPGESPLAAAPLRLALQETPDHLDGAWWPRSRVLATEAAQLVDQFPASVGRINRLLFSRPDWDDGATNGQGLRRIQAGRGPVKVGSFPRDDTHLMVLSMANGRRLRLVVVPSDTDQAEGERRMRAVATHSAHGGTDPDWARAHHESPGH